MSNQHESRWQTPGLDEFVREKTRSASYSEVSKMVLAEFGVRVSGDAIQKRLSRYVPAPAPVAPPAGSGVSGELLEKVRRFLLKRTASTVELANAFDVSPMKIEAAIKCLADSGFKVQSSSDTTDPLVTIGGSDSSRDPLMIDGEKFYGDSTWVRYGFVSDTHLGSKFYREDVLELIYDEFEKEGITHVFHGGNYVEGEKPHNRFHLLCRPGMQGQIDYFVQKYPRRNGITTYFVAGDDHEGWYEQETGIEIGRFTELEAKKAGRNDLRYIGYIEADVKFQMPNGDHVLRVMHAGGGTSYALSYQPQKIVESLEGGEKPHVLGIGHYHKADYMFYRNVHVLQLGTTKSQDPFMRKKRLAAHLGGWLVEAQVARDGSVLKFRPTFYPFFTRKVYEAMAIDPQDDRAKFVRVSDEFGITKHEKRG